jgi:hypothetical protein
LTLIALAVMAGCARTAFVGFLYEIMASPWRIPAISTE